VCGHVVAWPLVVLRTLPLSLSLSLSLPNHNALWWISWDIESEFDWWVWWVIAIWGCDPFLYELALLYCLSFSLSISLSSLPQQSLSYLSIFYHCLVERHSGGGNHLDGIQLFGPRSDVSGSIMSNRFSGNKRSNSDSHFTTQEHPETLHWSKVTKKKTEPTQLHHGHSYVELSFCNMSLS
jgi:hypothetical protein